MAGRSAVSAGKTQSGFPAKLPDSLRAERRDAVAVLYLARAQKRNAIDDATVYGIEAFFSKLPEDVKAVAVPALSHRLMLKPELWVQRVRPEDVVREVLDTVPTPAAEDLAAPPR